MQTSNSHKRGGSVIEKSIIPSIDDVLHTIINKAINDSNNI